MLGFLVLFFHLIVRWFMSLIIPSCSLRRLSTPNGIRAAGIELGRKAALFSVLTMVRGIFRVFLRQRSAALVEGYKWTMAATCIFSRMVFHIEYFSIHIEQCWPQRGRTADQHYAIV